MDQLLVQALQDLQLADRVGARLALSFPSLLPRPEISSARLNDDILLRVRDEFQSNPLRERTSHDSNGVTFPYSVSAETRGHHPLPQTSLFHSSSLGIDDTLEIELKFTRRWNSGDCKQKGRMHSHLEEAGIPRNCIGCTLLTGAIGGTLATSSICSTTSGSLAIDNNLPQTILNCLHERVAQTYHPNLGASMDHSAITATITENGVPQTLAVTIAHEILRLHGPNNSRMTGLRVSSVAPLTSEDHFWTVFEWMVGMDTDVLAIFQIDNVDGAATAPNWLMHQGYRRGCTAASGTRWATTLISWTVTNLGYLKSLFGAARHILGILEIPARDSVVLISELEPGNWAEEESTPYWAFIDCEE